ncbi:MAG TPA: hypothetical protein VFU21_28410, partial [Kofleriaceae bacterium]|nr:hypothetical protein [Kofleriaceae bacterium]
MSRLRHLLVLVAAACGGSPPPERADPGEQAAEACRPGPTTTCLADRARRCRAAGGRAHRLAYDTLPPITVGPGGLVRIDHLGGTLVGVDSTRWLACFAGCPEGGAASLCFPLAVPLKLAWAPAAGCRHRERGASQWQGREARAADLTCADGTSSILLVPELDPVRRDLVTAGAIDGSDVLAGLDGLAVEMRAGEVVQSRLTTAEPAGCDAFALPAGYRVMGRGEDFAELERAASGPAAALAGEVEKIRAAVSIQAVARAKAELLPRFRTDSGEACRARGFDPDDPARLEACAAATPETEAPFRAAVGRETARLLTERRAELDALTRRLL